MPLDRKPFFARVRADLFGGFLTQIQVDGIGRILDEAERRGIGDPRHLAYRLATVFHETGRAMIPVREAGGEVYLKAKPYYPWVGMGLVQVTWERNAKLFGAAKPEDLMAWPVALRALFDGMDHGLFTGLGLPHFFDEHTDDPVGARRIINGLDKASLIAGYHRAFLAALKAATAVAVATAVPPRVPLPVDADKPVLAGIERAINAAAVEQASALKPAPTIPPVIAPPHLLPPAAPTGWRAVVAAVRAHFGQAT